MGTGRDSGSGGLQCCQHCPCLRGQRGDGEGTAWWGQDRTEGVPKCFQSAFNARGGGETIFTAGRGRGLGGAVTAPSQRAPAGQEPGPRGTAGERDENGNKTGYGEGIPTGGPRGAAGGGAGGATPWPCR